MRPLTCARPDAPDAALYDPVRFSAQTLKKMCGEGGVACEFEALADGSFRTRS